MAVSGVSQSLFVSVGSTSNTESVESSDETQSMWGPQQGGWDPSVNSFQGTNGDASWAQTSTSQYQPSAQQSDLERIPSFRHRRQRDGFEPFRPPPPPTTDPTTTDPSSNPTTDPTSTTTTTTPDPTTTTTDPTTTSTTSTSSTPDLTSAVDQALNIDVSSDPAVQTAYNNIDSVLIGGSTANSPPATSSSVVVEDPVDAVSTDDTNPSSARYQTAATYASQNTAVVSEALSSLSPDQQAQYTQTYNALSGDPVAQLALQKMALNGDLTDTTVDPTSGQTVTTLSQLDSLANGTTPLDPTLGMNAPGATTVNPNAPTTTAEARTDYLGQVVKLTATPSASDQEQTETCAPEECTIQQDRLDPAEYVRLATGPPPRASARLTTMVRGATCRPNWSRTSTAWLPVPPAKVPNPRASKR
jgi:hypothetical protein